MKVPGFTYECVIPLMDELKYKICEHCNLDVTGSVPPSKARLPENCGGIAWPGDSTTGFPQISCKLCIDRDDTKNISIVRVSDIEIIFASRT